MYIRRAAINDAERLLEIYSYYVENTAISFEYTAPSPDEFRKRITDTLAKYPYLVLEKDGSIKGYGTGGRFPVPHTHKKDRGSVPRSVLFQYLQRLPPQIIP